MEVEIVEIKEEEKEVLLNLIEKYLYEFSQWEKTDVNVEGNYGYEYLDCYFEEENRYPYFIKVDGKLAGFAMISDYPEVPEETTDYCLSEFFMMYKYRRGGVGRKAVNSVLDKHHGKWQLKRHPHNTVSVKFCRMMNVLFLCVGKIQSGIRNGSRGNMKHIWKQENVVLLSRRCIKKNRNSRWKNVTLSGKIHWNISKSSNRKMKTSGCMNWTPFPL